LLEKYAYIDSLKCFTLRNVSSGENDRVLGVGHGNQINQMRATDTSILTCGIDDSLKTINLETKTYQSADVKLGCQPRGMDVKDDLVVAGCVKEVC
jgi:hypothetical protein